MKYFYFLRKRTFVLFSALLALAVHAKAMFEYDLKTLLLWTETFSIPEPARNLVAFTGQQVYGGQQIQVETSLPTDSVFKPALILCASEQTDLQLDTFASIEKRYAGGYIYYRITPDQAYPGLAFFNVTVLDPENLLIAGSSLDDGVNKIPLISTPLIAPGQMRSKGYLKVTIPSLFTLTVYANGYIEKIPLREYGNFPGKMSDPNKSTSSNKKDTKDKVKETNSSPPSREQPARVGSGSDGDGGNNPDDKKDKDKEKAAKAKKITAEQEIEEARRLLIQILNSAQTIVALAEGLMVEFPQEPYFFDNVIGVFSSDCGENIEENYSQQSWQDLLKCLSEHQASSQQFVTTASFHPEEFQKFLSLLKGLVTDSNTLSIDDLSTWNLLSSLDAGGITVIASTAFSTLSSGGQFPLFASQFAQQYGIELPTGAYAGDSGHWQSIFDWLTTNPQYITDFVIVGTSINPRGMEILKNHCYITFSNQAWLKKK